MLAGFARWIGFLTMTASIVAAIMLAFGFLWFAINIQTDDAQLQSKADGIVELTGAVFLLMPAMRLIGASILLAVILGVLVSFVRSREWMKMQYPLVLLFLLVVTLTQTYPLG